MKSPLGNCQILVEEREELTTLLRAMKGYDLQWGTDNTEDTYDGLYNGILIIDGYIHYLFKGAKSGYKKLSYEEALNLLKPDICDLKFNTSIRKSQKPTWTTKKEITRSGISSQEWIKLTDTNIEIRCIHGAKGVMTFSIEEAKELQTKLRSALAKHKKEFTK